MRTVRIRLSRSITKRVFRSYYPPVVAPFSTTTRGCGAGGEGGKEERKKRESERGRRGGGKIDSRPGVEAKRRENLTVRGPKAT